VVNLDIFRSVSTDVISVAEDMPFADEQFDFVLCFAVLEHVRRPWDVAREIGRVLGDNRLLIFRRHHAAAREGRQWRRRNRLLRP
jgi:2-polyprenyl-3-methyl-5-hydroxy-6-metoxy-1,4-benzoquinol methylase